MSTYDEVSEQEAYHAIMEHQRKLAHEQEEKLDKLHAEIEQLKDSR